MTAASHAEDLLLAELPPLATRRFKATQWLSQIASLVLLVVVLFQVRDATSGDMLAAIPGSPWFLPILLALYLALPLADWIIFRRLWRLPIEGFPVLVAKRISNELLLMYSGEAYFYLWARRRAGLTTAPFGTIKDVNILSALVGNLLALALVLIAHPFLTQLEMGRYAGSAVASAVVMLGGSLVVLLLSRRLFTLPRAALLWVSGVHLVRILAGVFLSGLLWHCALPTAPIGLWLALATLRLLVGRLPLVPNKELLFGAIAVFLMGQEKELVALIGLTTTAMLVLHLVFGALFFLWTLTPAGRMGEPVPAGRAA